MPIHPLAPTFRLNSRERPPLPRCAVKVPDSASWCRKSRTSWRNSLASGGSSTGSKRKLVVIAASSVLSDKGPQLVGALGRDHPPEPGRPHCLVAELLAPAPQPARRMVQGVLIGKAHRAMDLMRNRRPGAGRFAGAHLGDCNLSGAELRTGTGFGGEIGGPARGRDFASQGR